MTCTASATWHADEAMTTIAACSFDLNPCGFSQRPAIPPRGIVFSNKVPMMYAATARKMVGILMVCPRECLPLAGHLWSVVRSSSNSMTTERLKVVGWLVCRSCRGWK